MSGGKDRKSRASKTQGWEEAGGEFYQESYPPDWEGLQRDPAAIATLLPSKQNRAATTRRVRANQQDTKGTRRRPHTNTRRRNSTATARRGSQYGEVQVSMLPDLSQDLTDEERIWEEIHEIKTMPVSMAQKKEMKAQLQNATKLRLQGFDQIKWQRRKAWQQFEMKWSEIVTKLELWRNSLKRIEGNFGTGVVAYFLFLRWLMFLNLVIFSLILIFIVIPHIVFIEPKNPKCDFIDESNSTQCCSEMYLNSTLMAKKFYILDIIQGTGFMEKTLMFYGMYTNKIFGYHPYKRKKQQRKLTYVEEIINNEMMTTNYPPFQRNTAMNLDIINNNTKSSTMNISSNINDNKNLSSSLQQELFENSQNVINNNNNNNSFIIGKEYRQHLRAMNGNTSGDDDDGEGDEDEIQNDSSYHNHHHENSSLNYSELYYDLPLAYVSVTAVYFLISLAAIVKAASREFKDRLVDGEGQFYQYCNLIFGGWDFCIHNEKSADIKHKALHNEIKGLLHSKQMEYERHNRSRDFMCKLIIIRFVVNIFVLIILAISALIIYLLFNISLKYLEPNFKQNESILPLFNSINNINNQKINFTNGIITGDVTQLTSSISSSSSLSSSSLSSSEEQLSLPSLSDDNKLRDFENILIGPSSTTSYQEKLAILFYEFLPYIAIVCLNLLVPILFNYLVKFEQYSPMFVIKISLLRTVFLRLSSLAVLLSRFYFLIIPKGDNECYGKHQGTPQCWETFVGQQFYKLMITDFVTHIFVTFFINFPRAMMAKHIKTKIARFIGEQEFELSKHVLDVVYSQTLCWLGSFYAPFLPGIATVLTFFMFYIKKFACLVNSKPSAILYRASRSKSLFMFILLLSYVIAVVPVVYAIAEIMPSRSCGPFRGLNSVWDAAIAAFMKMPLFFQNCIFFLGTAGFAIPCFIILTLFLYYYYAVSDANKHMVEVLKNQLVLEGHDKQFLLNRLSSFIKQQQEYQKKMRQFDHHNRGGVNIAAGSGGLPQTGSEGRSSSNLAVSGNSSNEQLREPQRSGGAGSRDRNRPENNDK